MVNKNDFYYTPKELAGLWSLFAVVLIGFTLLFINGLNFMVVSSILIGLLIALLLVGLINAIILSKRTKLLSDDENKDIDLMSAFLSFVVKIKVFLVYCVILFVPISVYSIYRNVTTNKK